MKDMFLSITLMDYLKTLGLYDDLDGIKRLSRMENAESYEKFIRDVQSEFAMFGRDRIANKIIGPLLHEVEDLPTRNKLSEYYNRFLDEVYSGNNVTDTPDADTELDAHFSQPPPQIHQQTPPQASDDTPSTSSQDVGNENATNAPVGSDSYEEVISEESDIDAGAFNQDNTEQNAEPLQDSSPEYSTPDATQDEYQWSEATPTAEPTIEGEAADEEYASEQQQPETDGQKKQPQSAKEFSVADVDVKEVLRRDNTPKKE